MENDHEIISMVILLPSADSRRLVVSYKRKYVHEVLVNGLVKLAPRSRVGHSTTEPSAPPKKVLKYVPRYGFGGTKPVFGISDKARLKPVSPAKETS